MQKRQFFANLYLEFYFLGVDPNTFESSLKAQTLLLSWFFLSSVNRISRVCFLFGNFISSFLLEIDGSPPLGSKGGSGKIPAGFSSPFFYKGNVFISSVLLASLPRFFLLFGRLFSKR